MSVVDIKELRAHITPGQRLLGLDLGEKTIGLALSDTLLTIASPMETLARGKFGADAAKIETIVAKEGIGGLVIGLPLNMDGSDGPSAQSARAFGRNFPAARSSLPIAFWDERLSTTPPSRARSSTRTPRASAARRWWTRWRRPLFCRARSTVCAI